MNNDDSDGNNVERNIMVGDDDGDCSGVDDATAADDDDREVVDLWEAQSHGGGCNAWRRARRLPSRLARAVRWSPAPTSPPTPGS